MKTTSMAVFGLMLILSLLPGCRSRNNTAGNTTATTTTPSTTTSTTIPTTVTSEPDESTEPGKRSSTRPQEYVDNGNGPIDGIGSSFSRS